VSLPLSKPASPQSVKSHTTHSSIRLVGYGVRPHPVCSALQTCIPTECEITHNTLFDQTGRLWCETPLPPLRGICRASVINCDQNILSGGPQQLLTTVEQDMKGPKRPERRGTHPLVRAQVRTHTHTHARTHARAHTHTHTHTQTHTHTRIHTRAHPHPHTRRTPQAGEAGAGGKKMDEGWKQKRGSYNRGKREERRGSWREREEMEGS
jgi:hypothetical protein